MAETLNAVRERGIILTGESVRAILAGRKAQTRRVVLCPHKPWKGRAYDSPWTVVPHSGGGWRAYQHAEDGSGPPEASRIGFPCPYGQPGDRLWVREQHVYVGEGTSVFGPEYVGVLYTADEERRWLGPPGKQLIGETVYNDQRPEAWKRRSPIHMPRWASRITLEITGVRVERVQDISTYDIGAEGINLDNNHDGARNEYRALWDSLNAKRRLAWDVNPFCWVIEFRRVGT